MVQGRRGDAGPAGDVLGRLCHVSVFWRKRVLTFFSGEKAKKKKNANANAHSLNSLSLSSLSFFNATFFFQELRGRRAHERLCKLPRAALVLKIRRKKKVKFLSLFPTPAFLSSSSSFFTPPLTESSFLLLEKKRDLSTPCRNFFFNCDTLKTRKKRGHKYFFVKLSFFSMMKS